MAAGRGGGGVGSSQAQVRRGAQRAAAVAARAWQRVHTACGDIIREQLRWGGRER
jgi:hypothetical protein